ncbi:uncharacterized protein LOC129951668 [Eupeodes corollae]|uniref:uncharacterized protein LOC129951668 n=1 Tax=Eupeodes corollae TaxID=290404 RepID=UPI00248FEF21|nr:uncharacterized protein LOC129951668 [Eupeodes corollae]
MFCSPVLFVAISVACVASTALALPTKIDKETVFTVTIVDDVSKFKDLPAGAKLIPLSQSRSTRDAILYTLGERKKGDAIVSQASDSLTFKTPQRVVMNFKYPSEGEVTAIITFVQILIEQSNSEGRAYVVSGGIGQRSIEMIVEASNTTLLKFTSTIYGIED